MLNTLMCVVIVVGHSAILHWMVMTLFHAQALSLLTSTYHFLIPANNQAKAGKLGAIEVILEIMKAHISNLDVCYNGCRALCNITTNGKHIQTKKSYFTQNTIFNHSHQPKESRELRNH